MFHGCRDQLFAAAMRMGCRHLHILRSPVAGLAPWAFFSPRTRSVGTHVFERGSINGREGVDARAKPTAVRFRLFLQLYEDAVYDCTTVGRPWPDFFRPPTSADVALSPARKAWMAGPGPATGIVGCAELATNNRFRSTEHPWAKLGQGVLGVRRARDKQPTTLSRSAAAMLRRSVMLSCVT